MGNDFHIYVYGEDNEYSLNEYLTPISNTVRSINLDMGLSAKELLSFQKNDVEVALQFKEVMGNLRRRTFTRYVSEIDDEIDYRDISRRYFDEYPKKDGELLQCIIKALSILQNDMTFYRTQENSRELENRRNRFVSEQLLMAKYSCSDQQTGGTTASGKAPGERDFVVKNKNGVDFLIYEGLNLTTLDKSYVNEHIKKLLVNYNPMGLRQSVLVTYLECGRNEFKSFTDKYRKQISEYAPESYHCAGEPKVFPTPGQFMSCMVMNYETGGI